MATVASNKLGVYRLALPPNNGSGFMEYGDMTQPLPVAQKTGSSAEDTSPPTAVFGPTVTSVWDDIEGLTDFGPYLLLNADGSIYNVGFASAVDKMVFYEDTEFELIALATSSTLEAQNTVSETSARNAEGGSTSFMTAGALSWSISSEGLLDVAASVGSAISILDLARAKEFVLVKFDTNEGVAYAGQALVDSTTLNGGVDDIASYSVTFSGQGELYTA